MRRARSVLVLLLPCLFLAALSPAMGESPAGPRLGPGTSLLGTSSCAASFVFRNDATGDLAVSTAGHCYSVGERVRTLWFRLQTGPAYGMAGDAVEFGTVVLSVAGEGVGDDFALILVDEELQHLVDPTVPVVGGPCGWRRSTHVGEPIALVGQGFFTLPNLEPTPPLVRHGVTRTGEETGTGHPDVVHYAVHRDGGDSGSAVVAVSDPLVPGSLPQALAIHTNGFLTRSVPVGTGTSLPHALSLAPGWSLVSSPECP